MIIPRKIIQIAVAGAHDGDLIFALASDGSCWVLLGSGGVSSATAECWKRLPDLPPYEQEEMEPARNERVPKGWEAAE